MSGLEDADAVAEVLAHYKADPQVVEAFGGVEHISGLPEGPWPHLVVSPGPGGSLREAVSAIEPDVLVEVVGDTAGTIGSAALWRLGMLAIVSAKRLPEREHTPGRPVVSFVGTTGGLVKQNLTSGQVRWQVNLNVTISAPQGVPAPPPAP